MVYENYLKNGYRGYKCEKCDNVGKGEEIAALFVWKGFSVTESAIGGSYSMSQSFYVNKAAIAEYVEENNLELTFGALATGNVSGLSVKPALDGEKVLANEFDNLLHDYFEIKITGISGELAAKKVIFCGYVVVNGELMFLDKEETKSELIGYSYNELIGINA